MRDDESLVEAAVKMLILFFIMYLLASTWYFTFLQYRNGSSANTPDDMSLAARVMKNFTSYVAGLSVAGVDLATYNGVSALRQYISTGSVTESAATTFPGQIYQLYSLAFNSNYPEQVRAQFFGKALAITGMVIVTAGAGHFSDKFEGMLSRLNLLEAWPKIKAHLKDMVSASPGAAYQATVV